MAAGAFLGPGLLSKLWARLAHGFRWREVARTIGLMLAGFIVVACASASPVARHNSPPSPGAAAGNVNRLPVLPRRSAVGGSAELAAIARARGTGSRYVGTFHVAPARELYIQMTCLGDHPLTLAGIIEIGPCANGSLVETDRYKPATSSLKISVAAARGVAWAIYISQVRS
jgi:hypothetical protein